MCIRDRPPFAAKVYTPTPNRILPTVSKSTSIKNSLRFSVTLSSSFKPVQRDVSIRSEHRIKQKRLFSQHALLKRFAQKAVIFSYLYYSRNRAKRQKFFCKKMGNRQKSAPALCAQCGGAGFSRSCRDPCGENYSSVEYSLTSFCRLSLIHI